VVKCVCTKACFKQDEDYPKDRYHEVGIVRNFSECPKKNWSPLESVQKEINFKTASKRLLQEADFPIEQLRLHLRAEHDLELPANTNKDGLISYLLKVRSHKEKSLKDVKLSDVSGKAPAGVDISKI
jgi:hypothetical protein